MANAREINVMLREATEKVVKTLAVNIQGRLILATPVDTGFARSNWVSSIAQPITGTPGSNESIAGLSYQLVDGPLYIVNNVIYIERLNAGWSKQAPANFVEIAIQGEINKLKRKKLT